jgi:hypothetical protein
MEAASAERGSRLEVTAVALAVIRRQIHKQCRERLRPAYTGPDVVGLYSLVRIVSLCFALLYGQIQAITAQDPRLIW